PSFPINSGKHLASRILTTENTEFSYFSGCSLCQWALPAHTTLRGEKYARIMNALTLGTPYFVFIDNLLSMLPLKGPKP
ncbi:MAG: hypothetical protein U9R05_04560, partial [Chloroflexota bacterium]|nr:hypothetical protein [Chloroflexota bacterium]